MTKTLESAVNGVDDTNLQELQKRYPSNGLPSVRIMYFGGNSFYIRDIKGRGKTTKYQILGYGCRHPQCIRIIPERDRTIESSIRLTRRGQEYCSLHRSS